MADSVPIAVAKSVTDLLANATFSLPIVVERNYVPDNAREDLGDQNLVDVILTGWGHELLGRANIGTNSTVLMLVLRSQLPGNYQTTDIDPLIDLTVEMSLFLAQQYPNNARMIDFAHEESDLRAIYEPTKLKDSGIYMSMFELTFKQ